MMNAVAIGQALIGAILDISPTFCDTAQKRHDDDDGRWCRGKGQGKPCW